MNIYTYSREWLLGYITCFYEIKGKSKHLDSWTKEELYYKFLKIQEEIKK